ncbi:MAG: hypothetical protein HC921_13670 [Synechococcaceae cyanobacterium SM2_3_1]|nr:hypothetical protein [Synechococcaceae cyanobacterium SM2_3_1]
MTATSKKAEVRIPNFPPKPPRFQDWALRLQSDSHTEKLQDQLHYWLTLPWAQVQTLPLDQEGASTALPTYADSATISVRLEATATQQLLQIVPRRYNTQINDALLTALALVIGKWSGSSTVLVELEGHGREDLFAEVDLSRTVGWFTSWYPVLLSLPAEPSIETVLPAVKDYLRRIPQAGIGFGLLQHLTENKEIRSLPTPQLGLTIWDNWIRVWISPMPGLWPQNPVELSTVRRAHFPI